MYFIFKASTQRLGIHANIEAGGQGGLGTHGFFARFDYFVHLLSGHFTLGPPALCLVHGRAAVGITASSLSCRLCVHILLSTPTV